MFEQTKYFAYRLKYHYGKLLRLRTPVDVSLELSSQCNMACGYCLDPDTLVLTNSMNWKAIGELKEGDKIVAFDEFSPGDKKNRQMQVAIVEKTWRVKKQAFRLKTTSGEIIC